MPEETTAGEGVTDEELVQQVADQTDSELEQKAYFERESDGTVSDTEAAKADADEAGGS
jgi:hypothetical protein